MTLAPGPFAIAERMASLIARLSSVTPSAFAPKSRTLSALLWRDVAVDGTGDAVAVGVASCDWQATSARPAAPPARRTRRRVHARLTVREPRRQLARRGRYFRDGLRARGLRVEDRHRRTDRGGGLEMTEQRVAEERLDAPPAAQGRAHRARARTEEQEHDRAEPVPADLEDRLSRLVAGRGPQEGGHDVR